MGLNSISLHLLQDILTNNELITIDRQRVSNNWENYKVY